MISDGQSPERSRGCVRGRWMQQRLPRDAGSRGSFDKSSRWDSGNHRPLTRTFPESETHIFHISSPQYFLTISKFLFYSHSAYVVFDEPRACFKRTIVTCFFATYPFWPADFCAFFNFFFYLLAWNEKLPPISQLFVVEIFKVKEFILERGQ